MQRKLSIETADPLEKAANEFAENMEKYAQEDEAIPDLRRVTSNVMQTKALKDIPDHGTYRMAFARKHIMDPLPLMHSAVAFEDLETAETAKWLVFGRQTPYFLKPNVDESKNHVRSIIGLFNDLTKSKIDNEKNYDFFRSHSFTAETTKNDIVLTGAEVKNIVMGANDIICKDHRFNLVISNCYSASVTMLGKAIEIISQRKENTDQDKITNNQSILAVTELLAHAMTDNLSVGVINQPLVVQYLEQIDTILEQRGLSVRVSNPSVTTILRNTAGQLLENTPLSPKRLTCS